MALSQMMKHYLDTKNKYQDTILLYRLGDFYELFFEDAEVCSRELGLTLTGKDCGLEQRAPMCGMPAKSIDAYVAKLIEKGYKVAICEQLSDPVKNSKTLVERDVVRVITPGTIIESNMLDDKSNNYIASVCKDQNNIGASVIDISTGDFFVTEFTENNTITKLNDFLVMLAPKEIICNNEAKEDLKNLFCIQAQIIPVFTQYNESSFEFKTAYNSLLHQFQCTSLAKFGCNNKHYALQSAGALIDYLNDTQKRNLSHINKLQYMYTEEYMQIDANTRRNLELTATLKDGKRKGSLLWILDKTKTSMGARMLKSFIESPLNNDTKINARLKGVEELVKNMIKRENIKEYLFKIYDLERLTGKVAYGNITPKDCLALKVTLSIIPELKQELVSFNSSILKKINDDLLDFQEITDLLENSIAEDCSSVLKDGGFIKHGFNKELDDYANISKIGRKWIVELEAKEREATGIKNLKISYNKVFGYYIEVSNGQKQLVPYRYQRKQTLTNGERFITDELKQMEDKILNADDRKLELEQELFKQIRMELSKHIEDFQKTAKALSLLDVLCSFATVSVEKNYVKPIINKNVNEIEIVEGRHPVVESLSNNDFVSNDTFLNNTDKRTMIITGPNMAGKSTYMRQVAIITLMAHIGCFVPATSAKICLTDKIFTRIGASDDLLVGQSTFMVEMLEVSNILKNATSRSLIILDEVGRGTSTFDGLSIAWSVMEYISKTLTAKTLFATHFHELTELEGILEVVKNYQVAVKEFNNSVIFMHKIVRGGANKSFGIEVASLADLPEEIISRAREILHALEQNALNQSSSTFEVLNATNQENLNKMKQSTNQIISILEDVNTDNLTPLNAFDLILQLKSYLKKD
mgnify:FL=1